MTLACARAGHQLTARMRTPVEAKTMFIAGVKVFFTKAYTPLPICLARGCQLFTPSTPTAAQKSKNA